MALQKGDDLLQGVARSRGNTQLIALDGDLALELRASNVLRDFARGFLVDTFDNLGSATNALAGGGHDVAPFHSGKIDAALDELAANDVDNLFGDEFRGSGDGQFAAALVEGDFRTGVFVVLALGDFTFRLAIRIIDFLHVDGGNNVEAGFFCHGFPF